MDKAEQIKATLELIESMEDEVHFNDNLIANASSRITELNEQLEPLKQLLNKLLKNVD